MINELWKRPIPTVDYASIVMEPISGKQDRSKIDHFEDRVVETGYKLNAKVKMTFAGMRTLNDALYLPDEMYSGMKTFLTPYHKPITPHHRENVDPIGRVVDVRYNDTANAVITRDERAARAMGVFRDKTSTKKARVSTAQTFLDLEKTEGYMGVGHIYGLWEVTDPDAIQKVLDRRYLTVSTDFSPQGAHCSSCIMDGVLTDWRTDDCEHSQGRVYDGYRCVAVPYGFNYNSVSPVNDPAAVFASIVEVGPGLSFADAVAKVDRPMVTEIFSDLKLVKNDTLGKFQDSQKISLENAVDVIGNSEPAKINFPTETTMNKLSNLTKDSASNYDALAKFLPEDSARLTGDLLAQLLDSDFAGPRRTFLARDLEHIVAAKALLETVEDSDNKALILADLEDRVKALEVPMEVAVAEVAVTSAEPIVDAVADTSDPVEPEVKTVVVSEEAWHDAVKAVAELADLKDSRDILKSQLDSAKNRLESLKAENEKLAKDHKSVLAETLADKMVAKGFTVTDRATKVDELRSRTIESLKDSLRDLSEKVNTGLANTVPVHPSQEKVVDTVAEVPSIPTKEDRNRFKAIFDQYEDLYCKPSGERLANAFWKDQQAKGLIPANLNP